MVYGWSVANVSERICPRSSQINNRQSRTLPNPDTQLYTCLNSYWHTHIIFILIKASAPAC